MSRAIREAPVREETPEPAVDVDIVNAIANVTLDSDIGALNVQISPDGVSVGLDTGAPNPSPPAPSAPPPVVPTVPARPQQESGT